MGGAWGRGLSDGAFETLKWQRRAERMATMATIEGKVTRTSSNGLQLAGHDGWLNISKFADSIDVPMPQVGDVVRLKLDKSNYIREIVAVKAEPFSINAKEKGEPESQPEPRAEPQPPSGGAAPSKDTVVTRLAVLNTATAILSSGGRAVEAKAVVELAAKLEAWATR